MDITQYDETPFDPSKPVRQRNGLPARILATDVRAEQPIVAALMEDDDTEEVWTFGANGYFGRRHTPSGLDLVNVEPVARESPGICEEPSSESRALAPVLTAQKYAEMVERELTEAAE